MLRFETNYEHHHHGKGNDEEEEWRRLLRESMRDLNRRAFTADCKAGYTTPDQTPEDYYAFNLDDPASVYARACEVYRCIDDVRRKARKERRAVPTIEALPQAIRACSRCFLREYIAAPLGGVRSHVRLTKADLSQQAPWCRSHEPQVPIHHGTTRSFYRDTAGPIGEIICTQAFNNRIMNIMISNAYNEEIM